MVIVDGEGVIVDANPASERLTASGRAGQSPLAAALLLRSHWLEGAERRAALVEAAAALERGPAAGWRTPGDVAVRGLIRERLARAAARGISPRPAGGIHGW